jgi:hypothetical protein
VRTPAPRFKQRVLALALAIACLLVYAQTAHFDFLNYDDNGYVTGNPHVRSAFTTAGVAWAFTSIDYFYWQPLTWLSHMLDCELFGLNAGWHHLTNVLLHVSGDWPSARQVLGNFRSSGRRRAKSIWSQRPFRGLCMQSRLISQVVETQQRFLGGVRQPRKDLFPQ